MGASGGIPARAKVVCGIALLSLVLLRAPVLFAGSAARVITLVPFVWAILSFPPRRRASAQAPPWTKLALFLYLLISAVAILRGQAAGAYAGSATGALFNIAALVVVALFGYRLLACAESNEERWWYFVAISLAPAVFVGFNLLLLAVHLPFVTVPPPAPGLASGPAEVLQAIGIHVNRVSLPLTGGVNAGGAVSAAALVSATILALRTRQPSRFVTVPAACVGLYGLLLTDSRAALLIAVGILLLFALAPRRSGTSGIRAVAVLAPGVIALLFGLIATIGVSSISRNGSDFLTLNERTEIWGPAAHTITNGNLFQTLFGYGANGQITSGASLHYAYLFEGVSTNPFANTVHNLILQTLLDSGVIGLFVFAGLIVAVLVSLGRSVQFRSPAIAQSFGGIALVLVLNGLTEALPSYVFMESVMLLLLVAGASLGLGSEPLREPARKYARESRGAAVRGELAVR